MILSNAKKMEISYLSLTAKYFYPEHIHNVNDKDLSIAFVSNKINKTDREIYLIDLKDIPLNKSIEQTKNYEEIIFTSKEKQYIKSIVCDDNADLFYTKRFLVFVNCILPNMSEEEKTLTENNFRLNMQKLTKLGILNKDYALNKIRVLNKALKNINNEELSNI